MYEQHFGLDKPPFRITPDPEFFFPGGNRGAVLEALVYAITRGEGMVKVVGEVGSGKTMLCRMLETELPAHCEIVYLANPRLSADEILHAIAFELALPVATDDTKLKALHELQAYLLERHAANRQVIIFVEEAQGMPLESLEEIRMLSNLETANDKLLQIVLFGQPELDKNLGLHEIRQLRERITHGFNLAPFTTEQVRDYLNARVRASGYRGNALFNAGAVRQVARYSAGLLRRINVLADKALLAAFAEQASVVTAQHVRRAAADSEFSRAAKGRPWKWLAAAAMAALVGVGLAWLLLNGREIIPLDKFAAAVEPSGSSGPTTLEATDPATRLAPALPAALDMTIEPVSRVSQPRLPRRLPAVSMETGFVTNDHVELRVPTFPPQPPEAAAGATARAAEAP